MIDTNLIIRQLSIQYYRMESCISVRTPTSKNLIPARFPQISPAPVPVTCRGIPPPCDCDTSVGTISIVAIQSELRHALRFWIAARRSESKNQLWPGTQQVFSENSNLFAGNFRERSATIRIQIPACCCFNIECT
jgi:hypothetical protein